MDKQPVGQLPDLTQSNNDDEIMVITNSEYNQLKKEKISDFITDLTSTNENNALTKGTDGKMFVTDFGNADNITEGTLPTSVLPEIPLEKIPDIPKDKLPPIEITDLPNSGVTAGEYIYPTNMQVNSKGQIVSVENGVTADITKEQIDIVTARKLTTTAYTQEQYPDEYAYWVEQAHSTFDLSKFEVVGSPSISEDGILSDCSTENAVNANITLNQLKGKSWTIKGSAILGNVNHTIIKLSSVGNRDYATFGSIIWFSAAKKISVNLMTGTSGASSPEGAKISNSGQFNVGDKIYYTLTFDIDEGIYYFYCDKLNGSTLIGSWVSTSQNKELYYINTNPEFKISFGAGSDSTYYLSNGSIDLKSISIWADGQPAFSGNKTGIDTIIAPNYTVVGSPTISADGLLGTCSSGNGVVLNDITLADLKDKSWVVTGRSIYHGVMSDDTVFKLSGSGNNEYIVWGSVLIKRGSKRVIFLCRTGRKGDINNEGIPLNKITYTMDDSYSCVDVALHFNAATGVYTLYCAENGGELAQAGTWTPATANKQLFYINEYPEKRISAGMGSENQHYNKNLIDLNFFKVYINGVLNKQACLLIPYTETTDGTKVVDAAYFDRVQSCCEQTGQALYLTLDEQNQQYYLPQGTVSGMVSQNKEGLKEIEARINDTLYPYGFPMPSLDGVLHDNEIWLEGAVVSRTDYVNVFNVYGTTYGEGDGSTTFQLPDFRGKVPWGSADGTFGYIEAGLPNIKGAYTPTINTGSAATRLGLADPSTGAFINVETGQTAIANLSSSGRTLNSKLSFNASRSNSIYSDSVTTVQPPSFKVRWKTRYK